MIVHTSCLVQFFIVFANIKRVDKGLTIVTKGVLWKTVHE